MNRARVRWAKSTRFHRTVTTATAILLVLWITIYLINSAVASSGYLDTSTSLMVTVLSPIIVAFAITNLVLGLRLTARLKAKESADISNEKLNS